MVLTKEKPNTKEEIDHILHPLVKKWFYSKFPSYSLPQLFGVMEIHSRNNVLISAPTGATKTLTSFLSIINELVDSADKGILENRIYCVYCSPLKALNYDIEVNLKRPLKEIEELAGRNLNIRVAVRTGDTTTNERSKMLAKPPHILITTPESLAILLTSPKFRNHLKQIEWCIIDEIHALAENKRGVHLSLSLERLEVLCGHMTRVGLSATISPLDEVARFLVGTDRECTLINVPFLKSLDLQVISPTKNLVGVEYQDMHTKMYECIHDLVQANRTTLIFTNTRSATERVVDRLKDRWPSVYLDNIGAHHGSLSKELRHSIEERLRKGELKVVVSSTSLELGIDIGYIDLVILLGSPKSVARCLQRIGRSGHRLHETAKGRIIVLDRDDLVECSVLLKSAVEKKIDSIHIPRNSLDVLAQQIYGIAIADTISIDTLYLMITKSYCYETLTKKDFLEVLNYLSGEFESLEDRHIYAKIWVDNETGMLGRRGKMARVIYSTNIGTIPDESFITVKVGSHPIGKIDEAFLERLRRGDIFVLGGDKYEYLFSKGMVAYVNASVQRPPTIPSWISEMLPLSFDLAIDIGRFRRLMDEKFSGNVSKEESLKFIHEFLYVDENAANSLYDYLKEQYDYAKIPTDKRIVIEHYKDQSKRYVFFHSLYGRRVNDVLSRIFSYSVSKLIHKNVEIGINDNGFFLAANQPIPIRQGMRLITSKNMRKVMDRVIDRTDLLKRRFRNCAARSLMILRYYKGREKYVGRQQVSSQILINAVKRISPDFSILKEARREILEDLMDIESAQKIIEGIEDESIHIEEIITDVPSPFAFNLYAQGYTDILRIEDKMEFLKRMHEQVMAKISLKDGKRLKELQPKDSYEEEFGDLGSLN